MSAAYSLDEALPVLERTPAVLRAMLAGLPEPWISATEGEGTWSPFDVVGHLIHGERTDWIPRAELILREGESRAFPPFDRFAMFEASRGRTLAELLDTFAALRRDNLARLRALVASPELLGRRGRHPELGAVTLGQHLATWVAHDLSHIAQVARIMARRYDEAVGPWRAYLPLLQPALRIASPDWLEGAVDWDAPCLTDEARMRVAIRLSRENVERGTGGPFGAVVFRMSDGLPVAAGVNSVTRLDNSVLHAETTAIMLAQQRLGRFTLEGPDLPTHALVTSCEPCAMCLGAVFWSGAKRLVCGATLEDATALGFDEGPVFPQSYQYLETKGITIVRRVLREDAAAVLELYQQTGGPIYNP